LHFIPFLQWILLSRARDGNGDDTIYDLQLMYALEIPKCQRDRLLMSDVKDKDWQVKLWVS